MKKLLLFMSFSIVAISSANAQCVPDPQYTTPGIYPDSAAGFSSGCVGVYYEQLVTNVVPADTTIILAGFPVTLDIDDVEITSFTGLPVGLSVVYYDGQNTSNPVDGGIYEGGTIGCALISGTPSVAGTYNLSITVVPTVGGVAQSATVIDWYTIVIEDVPTISSDGFVLSSSSATNNQWYLDGGILTGETGQTLDPSGNGTYTVENNCGLSTGFAVTDAGLEENSISKFQLYPNPADESITISSTNGAMISELAVTNLNGNVVKSRRISAPSETLNVQNLENGIYFIQVSSDAGTEIVRFIKK